MAASAPSGLEAASGFKAPEGRGAPRWAFHAPDYDCPDGDCALGLLQTHALRGGARRGGSDVLLVLHDAGETLALLPVARRLLSTGLPRSRLLVLPLGQPATNMTLCQGHDSSGDCALDGVPSVTLGQLGIRTTVIDGTAAGRSQELAPEDLRSLCDQLGPRLAAVVTGINYAMQRQIGVGLQAKGARFATYYDGLSIVGSDADEPAGLQLGFAQVADEVWIPSLKQRPNGSEWHHEGTTWHAVGQPTLETWTVLAKDVAALRAARRRIYGEAAPSSAPAVVWFGGYGAGYLDALRVWCRAAKEIRASGSPAGVLFSLAIHPGPFGDDDRRVLQEEGVDDLIALVPRDISGATAALASNLTVSQGSTGGEQSLFAGKPAVFVDPSGKDAFGLHLGVVLGLIPTVNTSGEAVAAVRKVAAEGWVFDPERLAEAGVPLHATEEIANRTLALMGSLSPSSAI